MRGIVAVIPVKSTVDAKQRLRGVLAPTLRQQLALAMFQDVLDAVCAVASLADVLVVTEDLEATQIAVRRGCQIMATGARDGHTSAVTAAARLLADEDYGMMALPGDIPLVTPQDIAEVLSAHGEAPSFTIVPAHDFQGSNAVVCTPATAVPLRFGDNSFYPHLSAARACGLSPREVHVPNIAFDIDTPDDLAHFSTTPSSTRAYRLVSRWQRVKSA